MSAIVFFIYKAIIQNNIIFGDVYLQYFKIKNYHLAIFLVFLFSYVNVFAQEKTDSIPFVLTQNEKDWLKKKFRAIGYSSAATLGIDGKPASAFNVEDKDKSQRVEFRVVTDTEDRIRKIAYGEK